MKNIQRIIFAVICIVTFNCHKSMQQPKHDVEVDDQSQTNSNKIDTSYIDYLIGNLKNNNKSNENTETSYCDCGWSKKEIICAVNKCELKFREAYSKSLLIDNKIRGKLFVEIDIWKEGNVKSTKIISQNTNDDVLNNKILEILQTIKLDKIDCECESIFVYKYPIEFNNNK